MTNQRRGRARMDRAVSVDGTEVQSDVLEEAASGLLEAVRKLNEPAKSGNLNAIEALLKINADEFSRARSGANNPLLRRILEIREEGREILAETWQVLYRNGLPDIQEPV